MCGNQNLQKWEKTSKSEKYFCYKLDLSASK